MGKRKQPEPVEPEPPCTNADRATARELLTTALLKPVTKARANNTTTITRNQKQPSEVAQATAAAAGLASRVEQAVNDRYGALGARGYFDRVRAIVTNVRLGDLGTRLASGTLTAVEAASMSSEQMATKETATKKQRALDKAVKGATLSGDALTIKTEKKEGGAKMEWVGNHDPDMVGPGARFAQAHDDLADDATDPDPGAAAADDDDTVTKYAAAGGKVRVTVGISATSKRRKEQQEGVEAAELIRRMNAARRQSVGASASLLSPPTPPPAAAVAAVSAAESSGRSEARARATLKLQAIDAVRPLLDPLYKAGRIGKVGYKQTLKRAVQELVGSDSGGKQWTAVQIAAAVDLADTAATAAAAAAAVATAVSAPTLRALSADAVITLSHVHCPRGTSAGQFRAAARWLLPRCRLREAANGQQFEHLHARIDSASELSYSYMPGNVGFEKQNVGRSAVLAPGSAADELMWFEEWRDWSGVAKHGETGHGKRFHTAVDGFIEEEWTFYQVPTGSPAAAMLPPASYFNSPTRVQSSLFCVHLRTVGGSQRSELLAHFCGAGQLDASPSTGILYAVVLENRFRRGEFVFLVEANGAVDGALLSAHGKISASVSAAPCDQAGDVLQLGPPLWLLEDMGLTQRDITPASADSATFPHLDGP